MTESVRFYPLEIMSVTTATVTIQMQLALSFARVCWVDLKQLGFRKEVAAAV